MQTCSSCLLEVDLLLELDRGSEITGLVHESTFRKSTWGASKGRSSPYIPLLTPHTPQLSKRIPPPYPSLLTMHAHNHPCPQSHPPLSPRSKPFSSPSPGPRPTRKRKKPRKLKPNSTNPLKTPPPPPPPPPPTSPNRPRPSTDSRSSRARPRSRCRRVRLRTRVQMCMFRCSNRDRCTGGRDPCLWGRRRERRWRGVGRGRVGRKMRG